MSDIEKLLSELAEQSDRFVSSKEAVEELKRQGVVFEEVPERTVEESIEILFENRKRNAIEIAKNLPAPPSYFPPAIKSIYDEIREAMTFGLNGAAITLCGVMVEFTLKFTTYKKEIGGLGMYDSAKWDEFENTTFGPAIARAKKAVVINGEQEKQLINFKNTRRNPYNHYNIKRITAEVVWEKVKILNVKTGVVEERDIPAEDDPVIQAQAKPYVDAANVLDTFQFSNTVVSWLLSELKY